MVGDNIYKIHRPRILLDYSSSLATTTSIIVQYHTNTTALSNLVITIDSERRGWLKIEIV